MAVPKNTIYRNFWAPVYHGEQLNYCAIGIDECGLKVATRYCQLMGYERASKAIIANNVGRTNYIHSRAQCTGWRCNGFKTIECAGRFADYPISDYHYRIKKFAYPRMNHYRVDWCYDGEHGCGKRAAFSFCRRLGYMNVRDFKIQESVPATRAIGTQKLCFSSACRAFSEITCFR